MSSESLSHYTFVYYGKSLPWPSIPVLRVATRASVSASDEKATEIFLKCIFRESSSITEYSEGYDFVVQLQRDFSSLSPGMLSLLKKYQDVMRQKLRDALDKAFWRSIAIATKYN